MDQHKIPHDSKEAVPSRRALSFGSAARLYDQSRPNYPDALFEWGLAGLPDSPHALDLGAGTGKLTRSLLRFTNNVTAVEPDPGMRRQFAEVLPQVQVIDGQDSAIPLPNNSVNAVFVGQAWHWFNEAAAGAEIFRVLKPGGVLVIAWNTKDDTSGWVQDFCRLIDTGSVLSLPRPDPFVDWASAESADFSWMWNRTVDQLVDYTMSMSSTLTVTDSERKASQHLIRTFLENVPGSSGSLDLPFVTQATRFRRPCAQPDAPSRALEPGTPRRLLDR